jgi:hypothetical protein
MNHIVVHSFFSGYSTVDGKLLVFISDKDGNATNQGFSFVVYKHSTKKSIMFKIIMAAVISIHGLVHLLGFTKALQIGIRLQELFKFAAAKQSVMHRMNFAVEKDCLTLFALARITTLHISHLIAPKAAPGVFC